jgi:quercetin dioxygenase-like cupin family protein
MQTVDRSFVLADDEGDAFWFANALVVIKADTEMTDGRFALLDQFVPGGYSVPRHIHHIDDEAWYLLEGDVTFYCGEKTFSAGKGAWVFLPKGVPHTFKAGPDGARLLTLSAPSSFVDFVKECGEPATARVIPPQTPPDMDRMARLAAKHQIELLGPPPA